MGTFPTMEGGKVDVVFYPQGAKWPSPPAPKGYTAYADYLVFHPSGDHRSTIAAVHPRQVNAEISPGYTLSKNAVKEIRGRRSSQRRNNPEQIPGGLARGMSPRDFDPKQLYDGTLHELEHVISEQGQPSKKQIRLAMEIAMDHLAEHPDYYKRLRKAGL